MIEYRSGSLNTSDNFPEPEGTVPPELDGYDWQEAFSYATQPDGVVGDECSHAPVYRQHVKRIIALREGENDGPAWLALVELADGRFAFVEAGCDYTGWDCHASGYAQVASTLDRLIRFGVGQQNRIDLGVALPEDTRAGDDG